MKATRRRHGRSRRQAWGPTRRRGPGRRAGPLVARAQAALPRDQSPVEVMRPRHDDAEASRFLRETNMPHQRAGDERNVAELDRQHAASDGRKSVMKGADRRVCQIHKNAPEGRNLEGVHSWCCAGYAEVQRVCHIEPRMYRRR